MIKLIQKKTHRLTFNFDEQIYDEKSYTMN
jgi:hypothetical protein